MENNDTLTAAAKKTIPKKGRLHKCKDDIKINGNGQAISKKAIYVRNKNP